MVRTVPMLALVVVVSWANALVAAPENRAKGTLLIGEKTYTLSQAVAYETKADDETRVSVVLSDRKISTDKIKAALRDGDGSDDDLRLTQPHVRLVFQKSGTIETCSVWADNTMFGGGGDSLSGELKMVDGRVEGQAKLHDVSPLDTVTSFDIQFNLLVGLDTKQQAPPAAPTKPVKPSVTGTFLGNGKPAKLAFVSARRGEPFNDEPSIVLVFSEKDHAKDSKPDFKAGFGEYGSALILSVHEDGSIFGCQVAHAAHEKSGFSSIGEIRAAAFDVSSGRIEGHFTTDGEKTTFDETWSVDLKFVVPFQTGTLAKKVPAPSARPAARSSATAMPKTKPAADKPAATSAAVNVYALPFPADAANIEYKQLVEQITFKSGSSVQKLAGSFAKALAAQGWKSGGADLVTANSAILNLNRGDATLTIMVKPSGSGSQTTIFTQGLDWEKKQ